jgi:hypothetical protein
MEKQGAITITAAQPISHTPPQWLIEKTGPPLSDDDIKWLNGQDFSVVASHVQGWYPYGHIIEIETEIDGTWQYLALAKGQ